MLNSHTAKPVPTPPPSTSSTWQPIPPPGRKQSGDANAPTRFHAYMLLPGLSTSFHVVTLGRSRSSIALYRARAAEAASNDPAVAAALADMISNLRAEDGLRMAQLRGRSQLPYWSRLAMFDYRKRGWSQKDLAEAFRCSRGTVGNILRHAGMTYDPLSGERQLTGPQMNPPAKWTGSPELRHQG